MSEPQSRPAQRGRSSGRGGRGGSSFGTRGGPQSLRTRSNGENGYFEKPARNSSKAEEGELGELRKKYSEQYASLKEIFSDWTEEDLLYAVEENNGDLAATIMHISEGHTSKWDEVKKKDVTRSKSKVKEAGTQEFSQPNGRPTRGGRGGFEVGRSTRGARGGSERGRGGARGGRGGANGAPRTEPSAATATGDWVNSTSAAGNDWETQKNEPADDTTAGGWDVPATGDAEASSGWEAPAKAAPAAAPAAAAAPKPKPPVAAPAKTWSSLLKAPPAPPAPKKAPTPPKPVIPEPLPEPVKAPEPEPQPEPELPAALPAPTETTTTETTEPEPAAEEAAAPEPVAEPEAPAPEPVKEEAEAPPQPLTEQNLEKVDDAAAPQITETQASTIGSNLTRATPTPAVAPATPRTKAALVAGLHKGPRTPGFARRTLALDQSEPVVMPTNHTVDRATVQFGSLNLDGGDDIDDDREEPETVQPPQPSPPSQPIASLPPSQSTISAPTAVEQSQPVSLPRQAPGLPPQPQSSLSQNVAQNQTPLASQNILPQQQHNQASLNNPYNRFGVPDQAQQQQQQQKAFEPFAQQQPQTQPQTTQASQYQQQPPTAQAYGYPAQHQPTSLPGQVGLGGVSSGLPDYYNSYADRQPAPGFGYDASAYQQQLAAQQQQAAHHQQDQSAQRPGLSSAESSSQLSTSAPTQSHTQHLQNRYGIPQVSDVASGHATPSPGIPTPQTSQGPQIPAAQYPMNPYPAYSHHPAYAAYYMNQYAGYPGYGTPFAKQGIYGQPQHAFMSQQYSDHSSSPAIGGFANPQTQGRDASNSLGDYGRSSAAQPQQQQQGNSFGASPGIPDFLSSRGGLPQQQQLGNSGVGQGQGQQGQNEDSLKPFGENKPPTGPSATPLQGGQPRPASATSGNAALGPQVGLPQGAGGYPSQFNQHLHGQQHQQHQQQQPHQQQQQQSHYSQQGQYSMYGNPGYYGASNNRTQGAGSNSWAGYGH